MTLSHEKRGKSVRQRPKRPPTFFPPTTKPRFANGFQKGSLTFDKPAHLLCFSVSNNCTHRKGLWVRYLDVMVFAGTGNSPRQHPQVYSVSSFYRFWQRLPTPDDTYLISKKSLHCSEDGVPEERLDASRSRFYFYPGHYTPVVTRLSCGTITFWVVKSCSFQSFQGNLNPFIHSYSHTLSSTEVVNCEFIVCLSQIMADQRYLSNSNLTIPYLDPSLKIYRSLSSYSRDHCITVWESYRKERRIIFRSGYSGL